MSQEPVAVTSPPPADLASTVALLKYIRALCPVLLDSREADLDASFEANPRVDESLSKFISDAQEPVIYIHKLPSSDPEDHSGTFRAHPSLSVAMRVSILESPCRAPFFPLMTGLPS